MEFVHGKNEIVFFIFRTQCLYQPYSIKRSKVIKITITKLNKLKLELQSEKIALKLELLSSKKYIKITFKKLFEITKTLPINVSVWF